MTGPEPRHLFVLLYTYVENMLERRVPHREGHLALIAEWHADGRIVMGGALGDPPTEGLIVFDVGDAATVEAFVAADPYVAAGLIASHRVKPWTVVV
jgi:uncharacterized protein YciI